MMVTNIALAGAQLDLMVPLVTIYSSTIIFFLVSFNQIQVSQSISNSGPKPDSIFKYRA
jgi:hypothetical protein